MPINLYQAKYAAMGLELQLPTPEMVSHLSQELAENATNDLGHPPPSQSLARCARLYDECEMNNLFQRRSWWPW